MEKTTLVQNVPSSGAPVLWKAAQFYPLGLRRKPGIALQPLILGPPDALFSPTCPSGELDGRQIPLSFPPEHLVTVCQEWR